MLVGTEIGLGPGHIVLDGDLPPPRKGHSSPHFSAHVYCGQMAGWIEMPLGTEIGLGPGHSVLDGTQLPTPKRGTAAPPVFRPFCSPTERGTASPTFRPTLLWHSRPSQLLLSSCQSTNGNA